jgi:glycolate oxidase FAD binding subunit
MNRISVANENDVAEAVQDARTARTPLEIIAAGSKRGFGRQVVTAHSLLDVSSLSGIVAYEPDELIMTVLPGTRVAEIEATLATKRQRLGFDPPDWGPLFKSEADIGTIGGAVSTDASGPARVRYGSVRDQLLGIRAVNGLGDAFKAGGKVVKNVTGFDIPKLVCGAFGTLCVLTELSLRVYPKATRTLTLTVRNITPREGFALLRKVWASPLEATGLGYSGGSAFVRLEGENRPLAEKTRILESLCGGRTQESTDDDVFRTIANGDLFVNSSETVWRLSIPPAQAAAVVEWIGSPSWVGDCAGGILWLTTREHQLVRDVVKEIGGYATLMKADEATRARIGVFEEETPARSQLTRSVKAAFDPLGLFNPGRMWDGV